MINIPTGYFIAALGGSIIGSGVVALILIKFFNIKLTEITGSERTLSDYEGERRRARERRQESVDKLYELNKKLDKIADDKSIAKTPEEKRREIGMPAYIQRVRKQIADFGKELYAGRFNFDAYSKILGGFEYADSNLPSHLQKKMGVVLKGLKTAVRQYLNTTKKEII